MKYLIFAAFVMVILNACNNNDGNFVVSGKIKSPPSDSVFLEQLSYTSGDTKVLDSAKLSADGSYTLEGNSAQQNLFVISFKHTPAVILVNDANNIKIDFDENGFHYPEVSGSAATKEIYTFVRDYFHKDSILAGVYYQLDSMHKQNPPDTAKLNLLTEEYTKSLNDLANVIRSFVNGSKNPAAICFVLDKAKGPIAPDELSALVQNIAKRFPQHAGIAAFKTQLAQESNAGVSGTYTLLNKQAPDLTMPGTDGKTISISNYKGKYLLVDFWASWCNPCRQENPNVVAAYNKFRNKNFAILGVSLDDDKASWLKAIQTDHLVWAHMSDLQSPSAATSVYQFDGIPFNVLIDPQGKIIASGLRGEALTQKLSEVLQ